MSRPQFHVFSRSSVRALCFTTFAAVALIGCPDEELSGNADATPSPDAAARPDATVADSAGLPDATSEDAGFADAAPMDATAPADAGEDAGIEARTLQKAARVEEADSELARAPSIELFSNKEGAAIWYQLDFESMVGTDVRGNTWTAEDSWYPITEVIDGFLFAPAPPKFTGNSDATAVATWVQSSGAINYVVANIFDAATAEFGTAYPIYGLYVDPAPASLRATFSSTGTPILAFEDQGGTNIWVARFNDATRLWNEARDVDGGDLAVSSVASSGDIVAWIRDGSAVLTTNGVIEENAGRIRALRAAGGQLLYLGTTPEKDSLWVQSVSAAGRKLVYETDPDTIDAESLIFEAGARGDSIAVWRGAGGISASVRFAFGEFGAASILDPALNATPRALAIDRRGHAMLATTKDETVEAIRFFGGAWGEPMLISGAGMLGKEPDVAIDLDGDAMIVWAERAPELIFDSIWSVRWE